MKAKRFTISGVASPKDISHIEHSIHQHEGINAVRVDLQANTITVDYDEHKCMESDIEGYINHSGIKITE
jgi:Copper chaperone